MSDKPMSRKHIAFAEHWLKLFNGTAAYMKVYPKASYETARANASVLLANTDIKAYIDDRLTALQMSADEAMSILAEHARGDIGDLMSVNSMGFELDMEGARESGKTRLIKEVEQRVVTINGEKEDRETITTKIKLHDSQAAAVTILKVLGKFKELGDKDNPINLRVEIVKASENSS